MKYVPLELLNIGDNVIFRGWYKTEDFIEEPIEGIIQHIKTEKIDEFIMYTISVKLESGYVESFPLTLHERASFSDFSSTRYILY